MKTQAQMYESARRVNVELIKDVAWLCGLMGENSNPLTLEEIKFNANSGKSYSGILAAIYANNKGN